MCAQEQQQEVQMAAELRSEVEELQQQLRSVQDEVRFSVICLSVNLCVDLGCAAAAAAVQCAGGGVPLFLPVLSMLISQCA